ncbi:MAG: hemolysin III family protein [Cyclobacteriaceae bacterium]
MTLTFYPKREEVINVVSHLLGALLSIAGLSLLVIFASLYGDAWHIVSFSIFGTSMLLLYLASSSYHAAKTRSLRRKLNILDHSAIYLLIAGTYTPFCLVTLRGPLGWWLFGITWFIAISGMILKIFYTGRFEKISTWSYVLLGWIVVGAGKTIINALETSSLVFLIIGGVCYTLGAILYANHRLPYNHAIFHVFVLAGSICHFFAVLFLVV